MKKFVSVRTRYYKKGNGESLSNHIYRVINSQYDATKNKNVHVNRLEQNIYKRFNTKEALRDEQKKVSGRRPRSDFNEIFEHLLIFSKDQVNYIEEQCRRKGLNKNVIYKKYIDRYCIAIRSKYGFEPIGYAFHLDEGYIDENGNFSVNPHCHIEFYNYDFTKRVSPLKKIQKKVKVNGKNETNPAFSDFQDIASDIFNALGFERGQRRSEQLKEHLKKEIYVKRKLASEREQLKNLSEKVELHSLETRKYFVKEVLDSIEQFVAENPTLVKLILKTINGNRKYKTSFKKAMTIYKSIFETIYQVSKKNNNKKRRPENERRIRKIT